MSPKPRAQRRAHKERLKARTRRVMRLWHGGLSKGPLDPRKVGVNASTHCRPCGCWMCQEARKEVAPPRERQFDDLGLL